MLFETLGNRRPNVGTEHANSELANVPGFRLRVGDPEPKILAEPRHMEVTRGIKRANHLSTLAVRRLAATWVRNIAAKFARSKVINVHPERG